MPMTLVEWFLTQLTLWKPADYVLVRQTCIVVHSLWMTGVPSALTSNRWWLTIPWSSQPYIPTGLQGHLRIIVGPLAPSNNEKIYLLSHKTDANLKGIPGSPWLSVPRGDPGISLTESKCDHWLFMVTEIKGPYKQPHRLWKPSQGDARSIR